MLVLVVATALTTGGVAGSQLAVATPPSRCRAHAPSDRSNTTCEPLVAGVAAELTIQAVSAKGSTDHAASYIDGYVLAYGEAPRGVVAARNATVVNVVSGAANKHSMAPRDAVEIVRQAVAAAAPQHVDVVLFTEVFLYNGSNAEYCGDAPPYGEHMSACVAAAKLAHAYVVCPFYELVSRNASQDTGPSYNTAVLLDRSGREVGRYRKMFPTSELAYSGGGELSEGILPGDLGVPVFDTDFGRVAILLCWDMDFPELWHAAAAQGAELILWPAAAKGAMPIRGYAQIHNMFVAANGEGQFYDRLGELVKPDVAFNYSVKPTARTWSGFGFVSPPHQTPLDVPVFVKTLDLDSTVVFYGGPGAKQHRYAALLAQKGVGVVEVSRDDVSKWSVLKATGAVSVRDALRKAGIETRRQESTRNRRQNNIMRSQLQP